MKRQTLPRWSVLTGVLFLSLSSFSVSAQQRSNTTNHRGVGPDYATRKSEIGKYPADRRNDVLRSTPHRFDPNTIVVMDGTGRFNRQFHMAPGHMKKYEVYSKKGFSSKQKKRYQKQYGYVPPIIITVSDRYATRINGRLSYTDPHGFVYWKDPDGFYVLDQRFRK